MPRYNLTINDQAILLEAEAEMPLLWALRDLLGLTGTKYSCGLGICGTCIVLIDGQAVRSCITRIASVTGKSIVTIEGLSPDVTHPLQKAWLEEQVTQCGYCQPGQILTAAALLINLPTPADAESLAPLDPGAIGQNGAYPLREQQRRRDGEHHLPGQAPRPDPHVRPPIIRPPAGHRRRTCSRRPRRSGSAADCGCRPPPCGAGG